MSTKDLEAVFSTAHCLVPVVSSGLSIQSLLLTYLHQVRLQRQPLHRHLRTLERQGTDPQPNQNAWQAGDREGATVIDARSFAILTGKNNFTQVKTGIIYIWSALGNIDTK
jgi:hypothetical protein